MLKIGVQSHNVINDVNPYEGYSLLKMTGFDCVDFSLNMYLKNSCLYKGERNDFFEKSIEELKDFFAPHVKAAADNDVSIHQMHMPYPLYVPENDDTLNHFMMHEVAPKSIELCAFMGCRYLVVHGFKLRHVLGSEALEWKAMETFLSMMAPLAMERGVVLCIENLYNYANMHMTEGPCSDPYITKERIDTFNRRYGCEVLGFCFDTGHANLLGINNEEYIKIIGDSLKVLHIHDNDGIADLHQIPFTFTKNRENKSSTDWEGFVKGLSAIHFDGVLSFETAPVLSAFPKDLKEDVLVMINKVGRYFASQMK